MGRAGFTGDPSGGSYEDPESSGEDTRREEEALKAIEGLSLHELLARGQESLLRNLVKKSMAGTISDKEAAILRNLLRDNGMTMAATPPPKTIEHRPLPALPSYDKPDYED